MSTEAITLNTNLLEVFSEVAIISSFKVLLAEKELRDGRKYTYRDIEQATGVNKNTIGLWIGGKVQRFDAPTLEALCTYLDCTVGDLLVLRKDANQEGQG